MHEVRCARALERVVMVPGTPQKRFAREMSQRAAIAALQPASEHAQLTRAQSYWLSALVWRFRRQVRDKYLVVACGIRTRCATYDGAASPGAPDAGRSNG
jgi:hypothetical protein